MSQDLSNRRTSTYVPSGDTIRIDTLSIVPNSMMVEYRDSIKVDKTKYYLDELKSLFFIDNNEYADTLKLTYRVFPVDLSAPVFDKDTTLLQVNLLEEDPFKYKVQKDNKLTIFDQNNLQKNGSISRGLVLGNRQNLSVNSNFNLQLSGKLSENINILANISDDNIPIQAEGNTQQLQEFDNIFIKLYDDNSSLIAGDYRMDFADGRFLRYTKKLRGVNFQYTDQFNDKNDSIQTVKLGAALAVSKGKFAKNTFRGIEGNQGPYRLTGADNELFIIVLSGTEQVFIDGELKERGEDRDYVIDYNSVEITFTPNVLVTKDLRFSIEFQYSDKNYARSILTTDALLKRKKSQISINFYSEQDSKNQPLQQELSEEDRSLLNNIGDNLNQAVIESIDSVAFSDAEVLYQLIDSLGYDSVFIYQPDPEVTNYRLNFSLVGDNNGDYIQDGFTPNGRKFKWVAPDTISGQIVRQGDYLPVRRLVTPQKRQMLTARYMTRLSKTDLLYVEGSFSNRDKNTFSVFNDNENVGIGVNLGMVKIFNLSSLSKIQFTLDHEYRDKNFETIQRYREVEFNINWNYNSDVFLGNQNLTNVGVGLLKRNNFVKYTLSSLLEEKYYSGYKNALDVLWNKDALNFKASASILNTSGDEKTQFVIQKMDVSRDFSWWKIGLKNEFRSNQRFTQNSDSLSNTSFEFIDGEIYVANADTSDHNFKLFYRERLDKISNQVILKDANASKIFGIQYQGKLSKNHFLDLVVSNRNLEIIDENLSTQEAEDSFLGKINYRGKAVKNGLSFSTFYDLSSGLEPQREFIYIQVPAGEGVYVWVDYNENEIKELDEFEIAKFQYEADYIRTFTLTNDFQKTFSNSFSQSLEISPALWWSEKKGALKFLSRFNNLTAISISRKTNREDNEASFNPFLTNIDNESLISLNSSVRDVLFFNKNNLKWGMDFTYTEVGNKQLLSNGFEARTNEAQKLNLRWNVTRHIRFDQSVENGDKVNIADYSETRNYNINYQALESTLQYQPGKKFRFKIKGGFSNKENNNGDSELENEMASIQSMGLEGKFSDVGKGNFQVGFDYINIQYDGEGSNSVSFEMLNGLASGANYTWNILLQRTLMENLELNFNYNGRKSQDLSIIHSGGMQIRAFF